jgi:hypothetical protein
MSLTVPASPQAGSGHHGAQLGAGAHDAHAARTDQALRSARRQRRKPSPPKPISIMAYVEDSGTEGAKAAIVALPVLNAAVKKPDVNRVAFVSITN